MLITSFYTADYEQHAERLRESCRAFGYRYWIQPRTGAAAVGFVAGVDDWVGTCSMKAAHVLKALVSCNEAVVWLDADSEIVGGLERLVGYEKAGAPDFAIYARGLADPDTPAYRKLWTGTVFFNATAAARALAEAWASKSFENPRRLDMATLYDAWQGWERAPGTRTEFLPPSYCEIFDDPTTLRAQGAIGPRVKQYQASRGRPKRFDP